jgi:hypothetical protein
MAVRTSQADYAYGYGRALADGVVRPVIFSGLRAGRMRQAHPRGRRDGKPGSARGGYEGHHRTAPRTALDPSRRVGSCASKAANRRLTECAHGIPDAGAQDRNGPLRRASLRRDPPREGDRGYPQYHRASGREGGEPTESPEFRGIRLRAGWVAVRMVSEGVDIPRLRRASTRHPPRHSVLRRGHRTFQRHETPGMGDGVDLPAECSLASRTRVSWRWSCSGTTHS